jgi:hypothetical protein
MLLTACSSPPSDAQLIESFQAHRESFEELRAMMAEDSQFGVVRRDWMSTLHGRDEQVGESHPSITDDRWRLYRDKFQALGLSGGVTRALVGDCELYFGSYSEGLVIAGTAKGIAYCDHPPSPLVENLDRGPIPAKTTSFRSIEGNWYLFFEYN